MAEDKKKKDKPVGKHRGKAADKRQPGQHPEIIDAQSKTSSPRAAHNCLGVKGDDGVTRCTTCNAPC